MNPSREIFGEERFREFNRNNSGLPPKDFSAELLRHLKSFSGSDRFADDLTMLVFDVL